MRYGHTFGVCKVCNREHQHPRGMLGKTAWNKGLTKETDFRVLKYCESRKGFKHSQESKEKISKAKKGKLKGPLSEETKRKMALSKLGDKNPARNPKFIEAYRGRIKNYLEKHGPPMLGRKLSEETKLKIKLNHWSRKVYQSKKTKEEFFRRMLRNLVKKPNKKEILLNNILQTNFPNEWKYVGDGTFWIDNKCPDFVNINGKNKIIELFGDYWHTTKARTEQDTEIGRKIFFGKYGYSTLVIWDKELKHKENVISKVRDFMGGNNTS